MLCHGRGSTTVAVAAGKPSCSQRGAGIRHTQQQPLQQQQRRHGRCGREQLPQLANTLPHCTAKSAPGRTPKRTAARCSRPQSCRACGHSVESCTSNAWPNGLKGSHAYEAGGAARCSRRSILVCVAQVRNGAPEAQKSARLPALASCCTTLHTSATRQDPTQRTLTRPTAILRFSSRLPSAAAFPIPWHMSLAHNPQRPRLHLAGKKALTLPPRSCASPASCPPPPPLPAAGARRASTAAALAAPARGGRPARCGCELGRRSEVRGGSGWGFSSAG